MKIRRIVPMFFLTAMLSMQSCSSIKTIPMEELELLSKSDYSDFTETEYLVIKGPAALQAVYDRILTKEVTPKIDWQKQQVVLLALGQKNTGGYSIEIEKVVQTSKEISVYYRTQGPKEGERVTMALTAPYVLYTIDNKRDVPVIFIGETID